MFFTTRMSGWPATGQFEYLIYAPISDSSLDGPSVCDASRTSDVSLSVYTTFCVGLAERSYSVIEVADECDRSSCPGRGLIESMFISRLVTKIGAHSSRLIFFRRCFVHARVLFVYVAQLYIFSPCRHSEPRIIELHYRVSSWRHKIQQRLMSCTHPTAKHQKIATSSHRK